LALLGGVLTFVVITFVRGVPALATQLSTSVTTIVAWLTDGPLQLSAAQLSGVQTQVLDTLSANQSAITAGALTTAATIGEILTETLLVLFTLIFFLHGSAGIWQFVLGVVPHDVRTRVDVAGRRGIAALVSYVRATAVVAVVDAVAIGIGLAVLGIPLAVPLAALVFLGAFIPIIGAVVAGSVAVLIALVANGPVPALIVLGIIIAIMQLEGHVLQPLLLGRGQTAPPGRRACDRRRTGRRRHRRCTVRRAPAGRTQLRDPVPAQLGRRARRPRRRPHQLTAADRPRRTRPRPPS